MPDLLMHNPGSMEGSEKEGLVIVIVGPTAIGKTSVSIRLAEYFNTEIVSADSRQFYQAMNIGVARPSEDELKRVKHHFIGFLEPEAEYSAGKFATDAGETIETLLKTHSHVVVSGGSMLYVDALLYGFDDVPAWPGIRNTLNESHQSSGIEALFLQLQELDPEYASTVDRNNPHRIIRALEVCLGSGRPYSSYRTSEKKAAPFRFVLIGLQSERNWLYARINARVQEMMNNGLEDEARALLPFRNLNALNTVGYKELFSYFDGSCSLEEATEKICQHTRNYAKRQLTWWRNRDDVRWFDVQHEDPLERIIQYVESEN
jgi:tRNA dimethylallyltransferase